ncbi:Serine/arginine-rich splicing factor like [Actinidia chinensis var. chinensis]|uniref:Serine/arginine-rich splicing factor like n=1 Tax=Actinidia chinensis var. chinensis TaxID=1590841 RepID=A0A2R6P3V2_ACTCC|nr:Serine/arginine-rich splicing factor like [Actinidia chinensis var. chinensis]
MAVDVCTEIQSLGASPRISCSHDVNQTDPIRSAASVLDPNFDFTFDFDFRNCKSFGVEFSSADELFSDGKIIPVEIKKQDSKTEVVQNCDPKSVCENADENMKKKRLKEFLSSDFEADEMKPLNKPFWQFRRSSSMNCETGRSKSLIRSLQFLSRSNSTGSAPNPKPRTISKNTQKHNSFKQQELGNSEPLSSSNAFYPYNSSKRSPLKKNCRSHGNGVRISPVLNFPHNCIAIGTVSLFGFGSLFCNGKAKKKKK